MKASADSAARFTPGMAVQFQTSGRSGRSPVRNGTVEGLTEGRRGSWVVIREEGATEGVTVTARPTLVKEV